MKRIFLAKRNALLSSKSAFRAVLAGFVFVMFVALRFLTPNFFWQATAPIFRTADASVIAVHSFLNSFGNTVALSAERDSQREQNLTLVQENKTLLAKVENLTALIGEAPEEKPGIVAGVVARPPESPYDTLVVAAGSSSGVALGMEAFGNGGVPIGIVSEVLMDFSRVTLFTAPGISMNGWIGKANTAVTLVGAGGGTWQATMAKAAVVVIGDTIFLPGPGARAAGNVVRVDSDPLSPSDTLRIEPASNLFALTVVILRATGVTPISFATSTHP